MTRFPPHIRITPAVHAAVSADGHPELDRVIELPQGAPPTWLLRAYLLSVGIAEERDGDDRDSYGLSLNPSPWDWPSERIRLPQVPHELTVTVTFARDPEVGDPRVAVVSGEALPDAGHADADWQAAPPPFRPSHVNHELVRRFGVVLPYFDMSRLAEPDRDLRGSPRIARLLGSLTPVRRLALRAHLEDCGILDAPRLDAATAATATEALRLLVARLGADGVAQDPDHGWLPDAVIDEVVTAMGWHTPAAGGVVPDPRAALVRMARQLGIVRRLRGRVVATTRGRAFGAKASRAVDELVSAILSPDREWRYLSEPTADVGLALLAIADGSVSTWDELAAEVARAAGARRRGYDGYDGYRGRWSGYGGYYGYDQYGYDGQGGYDDYSRGWRDTDEVSPGSDAAPELPELSADVQRLVDGFAVFSERGAYGMITPTTRAIARTMLF